MVRIKSLHALKVLKTVLDTLLVLDRYLLLLLLQQGRVERDMRVQIPHLQKKSRELL